MIGGDDIGFGIFLEDFQFLGERMKKRKEIRMDIPFSSP